MVAGVVGWTESAQSPSFSKNAHLCPPGAKRRFVPLSGAKGEGAPGGGASAEPVG
jgi:hypothetical protein